MERGHSSRGDGIVFGPARLVTSISAARRSGRDADLDEARHRDARVIGRVQDLASQDWVRPTGPGRPAGDDR